MPKRMFVAFSVDVSGKGPINGDVIMYYLPFTEKNIEKVKQIIKEDVEKKKEFVFSVVITFWKNLDE